jgi:acetylglutamate kinase
MMLTNISGVLDKNGSLLTDLTARELTSCLPMAQFPAACCLKIAGAWMRPRAV